MNSLSRDEFVLRKSSRVRAPEAKLPPSMLSADGLGDANTALSLVSEAGQAMRKLEKDSREAISRATNAALAVKEKLDETIARAQTAEGALEQAEAEISELTTIVEQAGDEIQSLRSKIEALQQKLDETTERAVTAEKQSEEARDAIQRIVTAIRTEIKIVPSAIGSA
jgi:chromosome segregation ATPase